MFDIIGLALAVLKCVNLLLNRANHEAAKQDGRNEVLLAISMEIAGKVASKKQIQERVDALSDEGVDVELRGLEPK